MQRGQGVGEGDGEMPDVYRTEEGVMRGGVVAQDRRLMMSTWSLSQVSMSQVSRLVMSTWSLSQVSRVVMSTWSLSQVSRWQTPLQLQDSLLCCGVLDVKTS